MSVSLRIVLMASRHPLVPSRVFSRSLVTVSAKLVAGCMVTLLAVGCNDPELERQAAFERQFKEVSAEYAKTVGGRPDLLSTNPSDESITALRAVADKAKGLSGGSPAQQTAARNFAASVYRTTASIEMARASWLESGEDIVRGLAMSASAVAADLEAIATASEGMNLTTARGHAESEKADGAKEARALQEAVRALEGPAGELNTQISQASTRLSELGQQAAVLLRKAHESSASAGLAFVEEASAIKAEARALTKRTALNQIESDALTAEARLVGSALRSAQGLQASATAALDLVNGFKADSDTQSAKCRELAKQLRGAADGMMKSIADERAGALKAAYEGAANDLASASADANGDALKHTLLCEELRMRVNQLTGMGAQGRMMQSAGGDNASGLGDLKAAAQTAITELKDKATAAADQFASAGEDPVLAGIKAYVDGVKKMADGMTVDLLLNPPAPVETKVAKSSGRSMSGAAAAAGSGSEADLDAMIARMGTLASDPVKGMEFMLGAIDDSSPEGKALKGLIKSSSEAMGPLMQAMVEKFGPESLKSLAAGAGGGMSAMANPAGMAGGKLTKKSNDGSKAVYTSEDGKEVVFVNTASGWKLDAAAGMDPAQAQMIAQAAPMIGMVMGPLKKAAEAVAAKIRSGEITSAEDAQAQLQAEVMKGMGGGFGGGGRGGFGGGAGGGAGREGDNE